MKANSHNPLPLHQPELTRFMEAVGWVELGNYQEALLSLDGLPQKVQDSFDVLRLRWSALYKLKDFEGCKEVGSFLISQYQNQLDSWMLYAQAYYNLKDYTKACEILKSVESQFAKDWHFAYDYACYLSLTHDFDATARWIKIAKKQGGAKKISQMIAQDSDFDPFRQFLES